MKNYIRKDVNKVYFYGCEVSDYGVQHNRIDYLTLSKAVGDMVLNNSIINYEVDDWQEINGSIYDEETEEYKDFFQYYIIDGDGAKVLEELTTETVLYNSRLDIYLWCIDHYGTSWSYVLTDIEIESEVTQND